MGNTVWTAGQIGIDKGGRPGRNLEEQARLAFQNLSAVLGEVGGSLDDIVDLVTYHLSMDDLHAFAAVKAEFLRQNFPPWTVVGVSALALPELLVEVKATAVIGSGASHKGDRF